MLKLSDLNYAGRSAFAAGEELVERKNEAEEQGRRYPSARNQPKSTWCCPLMLEHP